MDNPFKKRATEFIDEPAALLSLASHEPLKIFFDEHDGDPIFEKLVTIVGTPGSGKTTISRLIELDTLMTLIRSTGDTDLKNLVATLNNAKVLVDLQPNVLAYRIPVESNLRDIWELPYSKAIRSTMLRSYIQAKAVLGWLRKLEREDVALTAVKVGIKENKETEADVIGARDVVKLRQHARAVEERIFRIVTALVPPPEKSLASVDENLHYNAFEVIETIQAPLFPGRGNVGLIPLIILDDAHELHSEQFADIRRWLLSREIKLARWLMTRVDALGPKTFRAALSVAQAEERPGTTEGRDEIMALLQRNGSSKAAFKKIANDISRRYIAQMSAFRRKQGITLESFLDTPPQLISEKEMEGVGESNNKLINEYRLTPQQISAVKNSVSERVERDEQLVLTRILLNREIRRTPQTELFADDEIEEADSEEESYNVKASLVAGAGIQMLHEFGRPFYFGIDRLSDASDDNIEQFINLAGALVEEIETQILRGRKSIQLDARTQHAALTARALKTINQWDFPRSHAVRKLISFIAKKCVEKTKAPNAPLDDGANAYGVPQSEMEHLENTYPALALVLHYGMAYNAISLRENYSCKRKQWCLIRLGGLPIIEHKLTFSKGGFCEGHLSDLAESIIE
jgi:hypothetical protein